MEEANRLVRYFVCSSNKSFSKSLIKTISKYRYGGEIIQIKNLVNIEDEIYRDDILVLDDELIFLTENSIISFLIRSHINVILCTSFKKKLPAKVIEHPEIFCLISKSIRKEEMQFQLDALEYRIKHFIEDTTRRQEDYFETIIKIQKLLLSNYSPDILISKILELIGKIQDRRESKIQGF